MKKIAVSVIVLLFTIAVTGQDKGSLTKQERKALRLEEKNQREAALAMATAEALRSGNFVLKADRLRGRGGSMINVDPTINFVAVQGKEAFVQVAPSSGFGLNGLGGVTLRGRITSMDVEQGKRHGSYNIVMNTLGQAGNLTIFMNVNKTGQLASASVKTNWGSWVELNGYVVPWAGAGTRIHKGRETF